MRTALLSALLLVPAAHADLLPHGDVLLTVENNRLVTGLIAEDESFTVPNVRVFYGELGADLPNVGDDPGFDIPDGTLAPEAAVSFTINGPLLRWDGASFVSGGQTMTVSSGPASVTTPTTAIDVPGFSVATDDEGGLHYHPFFTLENGAPDGVYLIALTMSTDQPGIAPADPIWILWGQNAVEADAEAAYEFAVATVPAPAALPLLAAAGLALRRRR